MSGAHDGDHDAEIIEAVADSALGGLIGYSEHRDLCVFCTLITVVSAIMGFLAWGLAKNYPDEFADRDEAMTFVRGEVAQCDEQRMKAQKEG